ncbi:MAG: hypothetical protein ABSF72_00615 [Candidatus Sulfotelmatobacter sp.]
MTRYWQYRLIGMVAALPWWFVATGHTQQSGVDCSAQVIGGSCETARKSSADGNEPFVPPVASQPVITYANGKLTVKASNASLAEVLRAISAQTGAVIDFPASSAADRIYLHEGPGTIRQVLADLLNGSDFNYVIMGSSDSPDKLTRVVLVKVGQTADLSPAASEQKNGSDEQTKTVRDPLLWKPPSDSSFSTPAKEEPAAQVAHRPLDSGSVVPPSEPLAPDVLEQMMKDRARQIRQQAQGPQ